MHKTEAKIGDKVIILRDRWENILLDRNELPIIYGTVVKNMRVKISAIMAVLRQKPLQ